MTNKYIKKLLGNHSYISKRACPLLKKKELLTDKCQKITKDYISIMDVTLCDTLAMNVKL